VQIQWCSTLKPPSLRPVFKEIAKICHHKIFHFKAGFTIKFYFDSKLGTCHQRKRYLRNRIPRNNHLRNGILPNSHLRNRIIRPKISNFINPELIYNLRGALIFILSLPQSQIRPCSNSLTHFKPILNPISQMSISKNPISQMAISKNPISQIVIS